MLPDRVSNPGPLTYELGALPIALRGPAPGSWDKFIYSNLKDVCEYEHSIHAFFAIALTRKAGLLEKSRT